MKAIAIIEKTREYLDYLEEHIRNVERAWGEVVDKCRGMSFIVDDCKFSFLEADVMSHDVSKLSEHEFVQYRKAFYCCENEPEYDMAEAWEHHKRWNAHHWETWTKETPGYLSPYGEELCCVHMVIDWIAMSYKFGGTARDYYEENKTDIELPRWAEKLIYEIFEAVYGNKNGCDK